MAIITISRGSFAGGKAVAERLIPRIAGAVEGVKAVRCEVGMVSDWCW